MALTHAEYLFPSLSLSYFHQHPTSTELNPVYSTPPPPHTHLLSSPISLLQFLGGGLFIKIVTVLLQALCLSNKARQTTAVGEMVNLMSVDAQCITDFLQYIQLVWSAPFQVIISLVFLYFTMGVSIFAGVGVLVLIVGVNAWLGSWSRMLHVKQMSYKDSRIKLMTEILNGIKVLNTIVSQLQYLQRFLERQDREIYGVGGRKEASLCPPSNGYRLAEF